MNLLKVFWMCSLVLSIDLARAEDLGQNINFLVEEREAIFNHEEGKWEDTLKSRWRLSTFNSKVLYSESKRRENSSTLYLEGRVHDITPQSHTLDIGKDLLFEHMLETNEQSAYLPTRKVKIIFSSHKEASFAKSIFEGEEELEIVVFTDLFENKNEIFASDVYVRTYDMSLEDFLGRYKVDRRHKSKIKSFFKNARPSELIDDAIDFL